MAVMDGEVCVELGTRFLIHLVIMGIVNSSSTIHNFCFPKDLTAYGVSDKVKGSAGSFQFPHGP